MGNEDERKKAQAEAKKAKLEVLEKKIAAASGDPETVAGKKHRFDDTEYLEESREIVDNVKSAVSAGLYTWFTVLTFSADVSIYRSHEEKEEGEDEPRVELTDSSKGHSGHGIRS